MFGESETRNKELETSKHNSELEKQAMIKTESLTKIFRSGKKNVIALNEVNLTIKKGEFILIKGPSGCGKSTLLFSLGAMLNPSSGMVEIDDVSIYDKSEKERAALRANNIGFVFQSYHLLPYLTVLENILISQRLNKKSVTEKRAVEIAESLKIAHRLNHKPSELSVGEKQRTALARVFITNPNVIFADEPTGNLDPENAKEVIDHLNKYNDNGGTVIMVTHGNEADEVADRAVYMNNGRLNSI